MPADVGQAVGHTWKSNGDRVEELGIGWPFVALRCLIDSDTDPPLLIDGMDVPWFLRPDTVRSDRLILPLAPVWPALAIDVLLFAAPWFIALSLRSWTRFVRRVARKRKGRCTECGYDLGGLPDCPECGSGTAGTADARKRDRTSVVAWLLLGGSFGSFLATLGFAIATTAATAPGRVDVTLKATTSTSHYGESVTWGETMVIDSPATRNRTQLPVVAVRPYDWSKIRQGTPIRIRSERALGWPFRCLYCYYAADALQRAWVVDDAPRAYRYTEAFRRNLKQEIPPYVVSVRPMVLTVTQPGEPRAAIPLIVLPRGLVLNLLLFFLAGRLAHALVACVLFSVRRARGRCIRCGYNLGGLKRGAPCPECGS